MAYPDLDHARAQHAALKGAQFLRLQILQALDGLHSLEVIRRAGERPPHLRALNATGRGSAAA